VREPCSTRPLRACRRRRYVFQVGPSDPSRKLVTDRRSMNLPLAVGHSSPALPTSCRHLGTCSPWRPEFGHHPDRVERCPFSLKYCDAPPPPRRFRSFPSGVDSPWLLWAFHFGASHLAGFLAPSVAVEFALRACWRPRAGLVARDTQIPQPRRHKPPGWA